MPDSSMIIVAVFVLGSLAQDRAEVSGKLTIPREVSRKRTRLRVRYVGQTGLGRKRDPSASRAVVYLEGPPPARAKGVVASMRQEGLEFHPRVLAVQVGTVVEFPNHDDLYHNVLSYSPSKRFDLGRYPKGETHQVRFDKPGPVDVFCEIHEHMRGFILVIPHSSFTVAETDGSFRIRNVPPGKYTLVAWHEDFKPVRTRVEVKPGGARVFLKFAQAVDPPPAGRSLARGCCVAR